MMYIHSFNLSSQIFQRVTNSNPPNHVWLIQTKGFFWAALANQTPPRGYSKCLIVQSKLQLSLINYLFFVGLEYEPDLDPLAGSVKDLGRDMHAGPKAWVDGPLPGLNHALP